VPGGSATVPAIVRHYAAYLRAWLHVTPQTSVEGNRAELRLNFGNKMFVAVFGCRKKTWSLRHIEIRRGEQTATFTRGELATAMAALLGRESLAPTPQAISATSGPRTDTTLHQRRTTVWAAPRGRPPTTHDTINSQRSSRLGDRSRQSPVLPGASSPPHAGTPASQQPLKFLALPSGR